MVDFLHYKKADDKKPCGVSRNVPEGFSIKDAFMKFPKVGCLVMMDQGISQHAFYREDFNLNDKSN